MTPLINGLYIIDIFSYNLHMDVALKKSKQDVNEATYGIADLGMLAMEDYKIFIEM